MCISMQTLSNDAVHPERMHQGCTIAYQLGVTGLLLMSDDLFDV